MDRLPRIEYFHVELDTHDVIWTKGAASETDLDDGERGTFQNAPDCDRVLS